MRICLLTILLVAPLFAAEPGYTDPALTAEHRAHWSFVPVQRPKVPEKTDAIDWFIRTKLAEKKLRLSPEASKLTLIRRLTFDLHGLPTTPAEIDAFLKDDSPKAYETLVDRLLASSHYGEQQAQHWLDVVRFAESNGYEADGERPHAWRYRDYVIRSFHDDKPYDRFLTEQIAGDLLAKGKPTREAAELWIATGLHRCGPIHMVAGNVDKEELRQELLTEMVNGLGSAVLGLTMGCTRCHDHKFDPLSQGDYYRLQAFFAGTAYRDADLATAEERDRFVKSTAEVMKRVGPIKKALAELDGKYRPKVLEEKIAKLVEEVRVAVRTKDSDRTAEQKKLAKAAEPTLKILWDEVLALHSPEDLAKRKALQNERLKIEEGLPSLPAAAWAIAEEKPDALTHVLKRGDVKRKLAAVQPGVVRVASTSAEAPRTRLDLAKWIAEPKHPLTARVIVNRLWQQHFGRGIVGTPNDFGTRGDRPTHPELLDWLAAELVEPTAFPGEPWSHKRMHKLMVMSATYRQRSTAAANADAAKSDPDNKLLWKFTRGRLTAEAIRDAILATAGTLNRETYGPSVKVPLEQEVYDLIFTEDEPVGLWRVTPDAKQHTRRSLYLFGKRNVRQPLLEAFDQPDTLGSCAVRGVSTFAPQALILMNGPLGHESSRTMAKSLMAKPADGPKEWIAEGYRRALGRLPKPDETEVMLKFLKDQTVLLKGKRDAALADLCRALFNLNEFAYVE